MAKLTHDEILAYLEEATILELNDLVKAIEEKFDVTAAAPVAVAAAGDAGGLRGEPGKALLRDDDHADEQRLLPAVSANPADEQHPPGRSGGSGGAFRAAVRDDRPGAAVHRADDAGAAAGEGGRAAGRRRAGAVPLELRALRHGGSCEHVSRRDADAALADDSGDSAGV